MKIFIEKKPRNYGARVYWRVYFGVNAKRQNKLFKTKKEALAFGKQMMEGYNGPLGVYIDFEDTSNKQKLAEMNLQIDQEKKQFNLR